CISETPITMHQRYAGIAQHVLVDVVQTSDVGITPPLESGPVETGVRHLEAVAHCIMQPVGDISGVPHDFFGHAAHVYTGSAQPAGLDKGDVRAVFSRSSSRRHTAAAAADHHIVEMFHASRLLGPAAMLSPRRRRYASSVSTKRKSMALNSSRRSSPNSAIMSSSGS